MPLNQLDGVGEDTAAGSLSHGPSASLASAFISATPGAGGGLRSPIWLFFTPSYVNSRVSLATCNLCLDPLQPSEYAISNGSTQSCKQHLQTRHYEHYVLAFPNKRKGSTSFGREKGTSISKKISYDKMSKQSTFNRAVLKWIIDTGISPSVVDSPQFMEILEIYAHGDGVITIPNTDEIKVSMLDDYTMIKGAISQLFLSTPGLVSFTYDTWPSKYFQHYLAITAHFITKEWVVCDIVLDIKPVSLPLSGKGISDVFCDSLKSFGLFSKVMGITGNNSGLCSEFAASFAQNQIEGVTFEQPFEWSFDDSFVRCFVQTIDLVAQAAMNPLRQLVVTSDETGVSSADGAFVDIPVCAISRLHYIVSFIQKSTRQQDAIFKPDSTILSNVCQIELDVEDRWSSTVKMINQAIVLREELTLYLTMTPEIVKYALTDQDWISLCAIAKFFAPLEKLAKDAAMPSKRTISLLAVHCNDIIVSLKSFSPSQVDNLTASLLISARDCALALSRVYYGKLGGRILAVSIFLDPRLKTNYHVDAKWSADDMKRMVDVVTSVYLMYKEKNLASIALAHDPARTSPLPIGRNPDKRIEKRVKKKGETSLDVSNGDPYDDELWRFLNDPVLLFDSTEDASAFSLLEWWKAHETQYPVLSCIARDYLAVQASVSELGKRLFFDADTLALARFEYADDLDAVRVTALMNQWNEVLANSKSL
ncbi:hypothetical protein BASA84_000497 [Batrachochytrium salamandrivorans]|nr:hypothetical protein BASA84_000497 [Batrachochytrium salamandrivorans]